MTNPSHDNILHRNTISNIKSKHNLHNSILFSNAARVAIVNWTVPRDTDPICVYLWWVLAATCQVRFIHV